MEMFPNTYCVDCFSSKVEFSSINNAVFLCEACAQEHFKLGMNVSYLKKLNQQIDQSLAVYIQRGGNDRFYKLMKKYNLHELPIEKKYITFVSEYYRRLLSSEVNCEEPPEPLSYIDSMRICEPKEIKECELIEIDSFGKTNEELFNSLFTLSNNNNILIPSEEEEDNNINTNNVLLPSSFSSSLIFNNNQENNGLPLPPP